MLFSQLLRSSKISAAKFNLLVLGGGSGGLACARRAAELGAKVALVESGSMGGTCVNVGCVPKKLCYNLASQVESLRSMPDYGIDVDLKGLNWRDFKRKRDAYIKKLNSIYISNLNKSAVTIIEGRGKFVGERVLEVNGSEYTADHIVIATGGHPTVPDIPGAQHGITSDGFFELEDIPESITVVGAGYIAVELCGILRSLGCEVNLAIRGERVLRTFDAMISGVVTENLEKSGVNIIRNSLVSSVERERDMLKVSFSTGQGAVRSGHILWAIGRHPDNDCGLQITKVETDDGGHIKVDKFQNTSQPNIYALGDVCGKWLLTPVAIAAGRKLAIRLFGGDSAAFLDYSDIPSVIFSHPPAASTGLSEDAAVRMHGRDNVRVYSTSFVPMYYALAEEKVKCHMKLVCLKPLEKVLFVTMCLFVPIYVRGHPLPQEEEGEAEEPKMEEEPMAEESVPPEEEEEEQGEDAPTEGEEQGEDAPTEGEEQEGGEEEEAPPEEEEPSEDMNTEELGMEEEAKK